VDIEFPDEVLRQPDLTRERNHDTEAVIGGFMLSYRGLSSSDRHVVPILLSKCQFPEKQRFFGELIPSIESSIAGGVEHHRLHAELLGQSRVTPFHANQGILFTPKKERVGNLGCHVSSFLCLKLTLRNSG
jgi:hypothetical protein